MNRLNELRWNEVSGNPFLKKLSPLMMTDTGLQETRKTRHKLSNKRDDSASQIYLITYGKDYVIEYIVKTVLIPLGIRNRDQLDALMDEVWDKLSDLQSKQ
jgi:hypothetical protein